jgi:hypothetical protein
MSFEFSKVSAVNQLSDFSSKVYEKAINISPDSVRRAKLYAGGGALIGTTHLLWQGGTSWLPYVLGIFSAASLCCLNGIEYKQKYNEVKTKLQAAVVAETKKLCPHWASYSHEEILNLVRQAKQLPPEGEFIRQSHDHTYENEMSSTDIDYLTRASLNIHAKKRDEAIKSLARGYLATQSLMGKNLRLLEEKRLSIGS